VPLIPGFHFETPRNLESSREISRPMRFESFPLEELKRLDAHAVFRLGGAVRATRDGPRRAVRPRALSAGRVRCPT
jgi:hypothetical protein